MQREIFAVPEREGARWRIDAARYEELYRESVASPEAFWAKQAREFLSWMSPWKTTLEWDYHEAKIGWFLGGTLNVCHNCVDRHLPARAEQTAVIWEGNEPGEGRSFTYREVHREVCRTANVLKRCGVRKGDRVAIYMPMIPQAMFSMLACARIGAIHSVIFGGFSAESVRDRILDSQCRVVITANYGLRGTKLIPLKDIVDDALEEVTCVEKVLVFKRLTEPVTMHPPRDVWFHDEVETVSDECPCEAMDSEDPLFILYTSGSTGKPKGVLHTSAGYLLYAAFTHRYVFDYHDGDVYCCAADVGWITGHSYIVYGPLANGATTMMFESVPNYPDAGRYWDMVERHRINIFYTAPTAIRAILKEGEDAPDRYDLSSLRVLGTVGEPINRDAWLWYFSKVGGARCPIVDTWWQTETGGILISPLPGATALKPGSATRPLFGIIPVLVDEEGHELDGAPVRGHLCISHPWPGQARTVYGDHERFKKTYFSHFPGKYFTGDGCVRDEDGYYWITGRVDDVLNVSGHRLGTAELESAIVHSGLVTEAAVVGVPHELKGTGIAAFCILRDGVEDNEETTKLVRDSVRRVIGAFAAPDFIQFVPGLPKTRSGKIMRRILRKVAEGERRDFGDVTTLADPAIVELLVEGMAHRMRT